MKKTLGLVLTAVVVALFPTMAPAAVDAFLWVDGVEGPSTSQKPDGAAGGYQGWIEVLSYSFGVKHQGSNSSTGCASRCRGGAIRSCCRSGTASFRLKATGKRGATGDEA